VKLIFIDKDMKITSYIHSCFLIETNKVRIVTDPYNPYIGFTLPENLTADIVTVSHHHKDHAEISAIKGSPKIVEKPGMFEFDRCAITGIKSFHDNESGKLRGENTIFVIETGNKKICHLGDLGHLLDQNTLSEIGEIDVLFVPVGGTFTIGPEEAVEITEAINPKLVIPMHYHVDKLTLSTQILTADNFLNQIKNSNINTKALSWGESIDI